MNHSGNSTYNALIIKGDEALLRRPQPAGRYTWSKLLTDADSSEPWIAGVVGSGVGAGSAQNQYNRGTREVVRRARSAAHVQADRQLRLAVSARAASI